MFIRTKTTPRSKNISVQLVETFRVDGKTKQRVVRHLGTAKAGEPLEKLKKVARALLVEQEHQWLCQSVNSHSSPEESKWNLVSVSEKAMLKGAYLEEVGRQILGIHDVYGKVYQDLNFTNLFSRPRQRELAARLLREIVLMRIANPASKRASVAQLQNQFGITVNLDQVYHMLDKIDDVFCARIQKAALAGTLKLTGEKLRVLFYDATTLYFESFTQDELKQNGYSKDMKFNQPQVLLTLIVTAQGLPVGYELFPGATFEGNTLILALKKLEERYQVDDLVVVADRGMLNEENIYYLETHGYYYIVGAKLKGLNDALQQDIINWSLKLEKEKISDEVTQRMDVKHHRVCDVKVKFCEGNEPEEPIKFNKPTYILSKKNQKWGLLFYIGVKLIANIPTDVIDGLNEIINLLDVNSIKKLRSSIKQLILKYHCRCSKQLVLSYRNSRAKKDKLDRERAIQKLQLRLQRSRNPKQLISRYGFQKFIQVEGEARLQIDEQKLKQEADWDGIAGIYTNFVGCSDQELLSQYRGLWQVEESFRLNKHDLKIRPIYHWTPQRIKAHIAIAFMAFTCVRYLEYRIGVQSQKISPQIIRDTLLQVQASIINDNHSLKRYLLPSTLSPQAKEIYRVMAIKPKKGLLEIKM